MSLEAVRIPITVLGGDFGCGKTTLLNVLLRGKHGLRLAVLINDFGGINIDSRLVESQNDEVITLPNGCICGSIGESFVQTLTELVRRPTPPEHIIIEASSMSDPDKIYQYAMAVPGLRPGGIIILADAATIRKHSTDGYIESIVMRQIHTADLLVLNKMDLVNEEQRVSLRAWLQSKAPNVRIVETSYGIVPHFIMLGLASEHWPKEKETSGLTDHDLIYHTEIYETWSYISEEPLNGDALRALLDTLPPNILRAKGVLCLEEEPTHRIVFQLVDQRWSLKPDGEWGEELHSSHLVILGLRHETANSYVKQTASSSLHLSILK